MLEEVKRLNRRPGEGRRRWFSDDDMDLILWYDEQGAICGFQLCYDKLRGERALTWRADSGFRHSRIDDGEVSPASFKEAPILLEDGAFYPDRVVGLLRQRTHHVPPDITRFVFDRLALYPAPDAAVERSP